MSVRALTDGARIVAAISALAFSLFVIMGCGSPSVRSLSAIHSRRTGRHQLVHPSPPESRIPWIPMAASATIGSPSVRSLSALRRRRMTPIRQAIHHLATIRRRVWGSRRASLRQPVTLNPTVHRRVRADRPTAMRLQRPAIRKPAVADLLMELIPARPWVAPNSARRHKLTRSSRIHPRRHRRSVAPGLAQAPARMRDLALPLAMEQAARFRTGRAPKRMAGSARAQKRFGDTNESTTD
jgi:hypothetical protein